MKSCHIVLRSDHRSVDMELLMYGQVTCGHLWGEKSYVPYHRVYYVQGGEGYCIIDGEKTFLEKGCLYFFPGNKVYEIGHNPDKPLECVYLHLHIMPLIINGLEVLDLEAHQILFHHLGALKHLIEEGYSETCVMMHASVMLALLSEAIGFDYMSNEVVLASIEMIQDRIHTKLTNEVIAEAFGYNTNYYSRIFTKAIGVTPGVYIAKVRLRVAIQLILRDTLIKETAKAVGYTDSKAFARFFKKHTGVAPSDYRKYYVLRV